MQTVLLAQGRSKRPRKPHQVSALNLPTVASGAILGRYRLTKQLGSGAFGTVWSARDERLDRDVAVKILPRERVIHQRFEREARAAARLQHPAIVTLYEAAVDDEGAYLVSELVRGRTLDHMLEAGKLSDRDILGIGAALCEALGHAHDQGVIHRDVKPSNILVANRSSNIASRAKLTDFGVAHVVGGDSLTRTGDVIGTLGYMAPEQAAGREATPSSDLYSLALVLYEALSGVNPLGQQRARGSGRSRHTSAFVPPIRRQRRDLSRALGAGIDLALRPRPSERGSLGDLRAALIGAVGDADETRGVVGGWGGHDDYTEIDADPGAEWQDAENADGSPRITFDERRDRVAGQRTSHAPAGPAGLPEWLPIGASAAGAGLGTAWLCTHLVHSSPVAPAAAGLIGAVVALLLPRVACLLTAVALGAVGLAGAFPAVVGQLEARWWRRVVLGAAGYLLLLGVSMHTHHNLYWLPHELSLRHDRGLVGAGVWGVASALAPARFGRRWPTLALILTGIWAAVTVSAIQAFGARPLAGAAAGAVVAFLVAGLPALVTLGREVTAQRA